MAESTLATPFPWPPTCDGQEATQGVRRWWQGRKTTQQTCLSGQISNYQHCSLPARKAQVPAQPTCGHTHPHTSTCLHMYPHVPTRILTYPHVSTCPHASTCIHQWSPLNEFSARTSLVCHKRKCLEAQGDGMLACVYHVRPAHSPWEGPKVCLLPQL